MSKGQESDISSKYRAELIEILDRAYGPAEAVTQDETTSEIEQKRTPRVRKFRAVAPLVLATIVALGLTATVAKTGFDYSDNHIKETERIQSNARQVANKEYPLIEARDMEDLTRRMVMWDITYHANIMANQKNNIDAVISGFGPVVAGSIGFIASLIIGPYCIYRRYRQE